MSGIPKSIFNHKDQIMNRKPLILSKFARSALILLGAGRRVLIAFISIVFGLAVQSTGSMANVSITITNPPYNAIPNNPYVKDSPITHMRPISRFDVGGRQIDAHDGAIENFNGVYYWYGTSYNCGFYWVGSGDGRKFCGIKVYKSYDLVHWIDVGAERSPAGERLAFSTDPENIDEFWQTNCAGGSGCFRPHVLYNAKTQKYVMWVNVNKDHGGLSGARVMTSDYPEGPFVNPERPNFLVAFNWDFSLFKDPDNNKAYVIYNSGVRESRGNDIWIQLLNDSYTDGYEPTCAQSPNAIPYPALINKYTESPQYDAYGNRIDFTPYSHQRVVDGGVLVHDYQPFRSIANVTENCSTARRVFMSVEPTQDLYDTDSYQVEAPFLFKKDGIFYAFTSKSAGYGAFPQKVYWQSSTDPMIWQDSVFNVASVHGGYAQTTGATRIDTTEGPKWMFQTDLWSPFSHPIDGGTSGNQAIAQQFWLEIPFSFAGVDNFDAGLSAWTSSWNELLTATPPINFPDARGLTFNPGEINAQGPARVWNAFTDVGVNVARAQSFTIPYAGKLTSVSVNVFSEIHAPLIGANAVVPTVPLVMNLYAADIKGKPMGSVLATSSTMVKYSAHPVSLNLPTPINVVPGQRYAVVIQSSADYATTAPRFHGFLYNDSDPYKGGVESYLKNGVRWISEPNRDLKFQFVVVPTLMVTNSGGGCISQSSNSLTIGAAVNVDSACVYDNSHQALQAIPQDNGSVQLQFAHSSLCLNVPNSANLTKAVQNVCIGIPDLTLSQWYPASTAIPNRYLLRSARDVSKCLTNSSGSLLISDCAGYEKSENSMYFLWSFGERITSPQWALFNNTSTLIGSTPAWDENYAQGGCADSQAVIGVSKSTAGNPSAFGERVMCQPDLIDPAANTSSVLLPFGVTDYQLAQRVYWDPIGSIRNECDTNSHVSGISQSMTAGGDDVRSIRCSTSGFNTANNCEVRNIYDGAGYTGLFGDWEQKYYKAECSAGKVAVGVSIDATTRSLRSLLCCAVSTNTTSSSNTASYDTNTSRLVVPNLAVSVSAGGEPAVQNYSVELQQRSGGAYVFDLDLSKFKQLSDAVSDICTATYSTTTTRMVIPCLAVASVTPIFGGTPSETRNYSIELQQRSAGNFVFDLK